MKIAMVDPAAYSLPYDTELCGVLADEGHDVTLYTTRFAHGPMPEADGFRIVEWFYQRELPGLPRRASRGLQHPVDLLRLARHLLRERPDVVHVQWSVMQAIDIPVWRRLPLPTVFTAHNALPRDEHGRSLQCDELAAFDAVLVHSRWGERALRERCGLPGLRRIPIGAIDTYSDVPDPEQPPVELGEGPVVAMTGLLRPYKGVQVLLDAWPGVREAVPDAQLIVAGRPAGIDLPSHPPEGAHLVTRFVTDEEYAWILRRADVICLPYLAIDMSAVLMTALAMGRPMVLSDVGGFPEFDDAGARVVPREDPEALATALVELLRDQAQREELSRQALHAAATRHSWPEIARSYTELYQQLAGKPAPAR